MRMFSLILSAILIATPAVSQDWEYGISHSVTNN